MLGLGLGLGPLWDEASCHDAEVDPVVFHPSGIDHVIETFGVLIQPGVRVAGQD